MTFGLPQTHWATVTELAVVPLQHFGATVFVFGSRARGDHSEFSDLDLLYDAPKEVPLASIANINAALEESDLPIRVDVVNLADLPKSFLASVRNERVELPPSTVNRGE